jgi:phage shock protein A
MNERQLERNRGRILALRMHIDRVMEKAKKLSDVGEDALAKKHLARIPGFEEELERRKHEMQAAGYGELLKELLKNDPRTH